MEPQRDVITVQQDGILMLPRPVSIFLMAISHCSSVYIVHCILPAAGILRSGVNHKHHGCTFTLRTHTAFKYLESREMRAINLAEGLFIIPMGKR
jgi:hypothetical protein